MSRGIQYSQSTLNEAYDYRVCLTCVGCFGCTIGLVISLACAMNIIPWSDNFVIMMFQILAPMLCLAIPCAYVLKLGVNSCMVGEPDIGEPPPVFVPPPQQNIGAYPSPYYVPSRQPYPASLQLPSGAPMASMENLGSIEQISSRNETSREENSELPPPYAEAVEMNKSIS